ncbi:MAG TPA: alpha/beta hydrolase [Acidimicrobiales bacterium]|nr:alpha/beta hydrolase [Acidimicrobiales bacterium]
MAHGTHHALHIVEQVPADPDAPLVVLVHGSLDRAASFARVMRRLRDLDVVAYDRRGYHHSRQAAPAAAGLDDHVADLVAIVGGRRAALVGHSLGGDVVLAAAVAAPGSVTAVGVYEPPLPWLEWWPRRPRGDAPDPAAFAESFFRRMVGDDAWERLPERTRQERRAEGATLLAELSSLRMETAPFDVTALACPLLVGRGEASLWHHRRAADALVEARPGTRIVEIEGAAHGAHRTHADAFADFVRQVVSAGR